MEGLGCPLGGDDGVGIVEQCECLVSAVGHFGDDFEVVYVSDGLVSCERDGDAGSSEGNGGSGKESNDS